MELSYAFLYPPYSFAVRIKFCTCFDEGISRDIAQIVSSRSRVKSEVLKRINAWQSIKIISAM